jgi:single-stranded DNA-binding protein
MLNQVVIVGRISELYKNNEITEMTVSVQRTFENIDGVYGNDFIKCNLMGEMVKNTLENCSLGDIVGLKGRIQSDEKKNIVIVEKITFLCQKRNK